MLLFASTLAMVESDVLCTQHAFNFTSGLLVIHLQPSEAVYSSGCWGIQGLKYVYSKYGPHLISNRYGTLTICLISLPPHPRIQS